MSGIDLTRALKAPFEDNDWPTKTLLGFVWVFLVVTLPAVYGAQIEYIRRVASNDEQLPAWDEFGDKWISGLLVMIAGLIYSLPLVVLGLLYVVPVASVAVLEGEPGLLTGGTAIGGACVLGLLAVVYSIAMSVLFMAAQVNYAISGNFGAFFEFGRIIGRVRSNSGYFTAWMFSLLIAFGSSVTVSVLSSVSGGAFGLATPAITYLTMMMTGHLMGQWASRAYGVAPRVPGPGHTPETGWGAPPSGPVGYPPPPAQAPYSPAPPSDVYAPPPASPEPPYGKQRP